MTIPRRSLWIALLLIALPAVTACGLLRPPAAPDNAGPGVDLSDPEVGGGVGVATGPQTPIPTATATREDSPRLDATAAAGATFPPATAPPTVAAPAEPGLTPAVEPILPPTAEPTATPEPSPTPPSEIIHQVQAGENLYRIGLIYGLSWAAIAAYNGIANPDAITTGQELRIPPTPTPTPEA